MLWRSILRWFLVRAAGFLWTSSRSAWATHPVREAIACGSSSRTRAFLDQQDCLFEVSLPDPAHRSVHAGHRAHTLNPFGPARDAREYLRGRLQYNAIVNDCFVGAEPVASLATLEAAQAIRRRLVPGGVYLTNVVSRDNCGDLTFLRDQVATLSRAFLHVHIVPCEDERFGGEDNFLVIATDSDVSVPTAVPYDKVFLGEVLRD